MNGSVLPLWNRMTKPAHTRFARRIGIGVVAFALLFGVFPAEADESRPAPPAPEINAVAGTGDWKSERQAVGRAAQAWRIAATRGQDGSLYGRIEVDESPLLRARNLSGWVVGKTVSGTVTDDDGAFLAKFEGEVDGEWMSGTYTSADGDRGTWVWAEPSARALAEGDDAIAVE